MSTQISRLRRWFALAAIFSILVVSGMYLYARHKVRNALKEVPEKIGLEIQQTAKGFSISKSEQGRTLFRVEASKAMQYKGCQRIILTDISRDGMLTGPNLHLLKTVAEAVQISVIQSGGVGNLEHVREIQKQGIAEGVIIGRAIYEGKITVKEAVSVTRR